MNGTAPQYDPETDGGFMGVVRAWREANGLTQAVMAALIQAKRPTYISWEATGFRGSIVYAARIAKVLDTTIDELLDPNWRRVASYSNRRGVWNMLRAAMGDDDAERARDTVEASLGIAQSKTKPRKRRE